MTINHLPVDQIITGDCVEVLKSFPDKSIDLVFADPPYFLQLQNELWRPNLSKVDAVQDDWDRFADWEEYDKFSAAWLAASKRVLKDSGSIWVIGTYHNIFRLGKIMQDMGFWFLNDIIWIKANPMPNFHGVRFTNAHETLIWAIKSKKERYTFNYHSLKSLNEGLQMRSDWHIPICSGGERIKSKGRKVHSTQKPEALLYRIIIATTNPGDIILDPFFGTGTTGAVAKKLHRHWIGIEKDASYVRLAKERIDQISPASYDLSLFEGRKTRRVRIPFGNLMEYGLLSPGQQLYFNGNPDMIALIAADGQLVMNGMSGSIHQLGSLLMNGKPCNGWEHWFYRNDDGTFKPINELRENLRSEQSIEIS